MAYGDGNITQIGRNHFRVRVDFGKDPITGKRQMVSRNVRGTKAEARKVRDQLLRERDGGIKANANKVTLSEFIKTWEAARRSSGTAEPDTIDGDLVRLAHVERYIGTMPITKIDAQTIERVYAAIREERGLSGTSMHHIHTLLKNVMQKAVDYDLILRNPCDKVTVPKRDESDREALSAAEVARLASCLNQEERNHRDSMAEKEERMAKLPKTENRAAVRGTSRMGCIQAVRIGLATGMRRGEVLGLEWGSVDFEAGTIRVDQSLTRHGTTKEPKTKAGVRTIHIDKATTLHLWKWKREQASLLASIDVEQGDTTPVCCNDKGGYMDSANFERFWRHFKKDYGFEGLIFHELRHTQATQLVANSVDPKTVQVRMGHSDISTTLKYYSHPVEGNDEGAAGLVGSLLSSGDSQGSSEQDFLANVS